MRTRTLGPAALLCVSLLFIASVAHADGTISGVIINGFTGDPVRGATLVVEGTDISFGSGVGGDFRSSVPAGTYSVVVTKDGFETQRVTDLVVRDGGNADFAVVMLPASDAPPIVDEPEAVPAPAADTVDESEEIGSATSLESAPVVADAAPAAAATDEPDAAGDSGVFIGQITVEAAADDATEVALLAERKNAAEISDAIGSEAVSYTHLTLPTS